MPPQAIPPEGAPAQAPRVPPDGMAAQTPPADMEFPQDAELIEDEEEEPSLLRRLLPILIAAAAVALVGLAVFLLFFRGKEAPPPPPDEPPPPPVYCAEGEHVWKDATCTEPKTCEVCGLTEGEPLGHDFVDNICTRCGMFDRMFVFSELSSKRRGASVVFSGVIDSYSPLPVQNLHAKVELFDEDKNLVSTNWAYLFEDTPVKPREKAQWRIVCDDSQVTWKYWSVSIMGYTYA